MGQPTIRTTDEGMRSAIQMFGDKYGEFTTLGQGVDQEIVSLMAVFRGPQATKFQEAMNQWQQGFNKITNQLQGLVESMGGNAREYTQTEDSGVQTGQQFMSSLPGFN